VTRIELVEARCHAPSADDANGVQRWRRQLAEHDRYGVAPGLDVAESSPGLKPIAALES
jgi:hypothetical protein